MPLGTGRNEGKSQKIGQLDYPEAMAPFMFSGPHYLVQYAGIGPDTSFYPV